MCAETCGIFMSLKTILQSDCAVILSQQYGLLASGSSTTFDDVTIFILATLVLICICLIVMMLNIVSCTYLPALNPFLNDYLCVLKFSSFIICFS